MTDTITLTGIVATPPREMHTESGLSICSFRLASSQRRFDRNRNEWVDGDTNWYTVTAFRNLAENISASLAKGDHVVVSGRLRVRSWETEQRSGTTVEVDAEALGHDLLWGRSQFSRKPLTKPGAPAPGGGQDPAVPPIGELASVAASAPLNAPILAAGTAPSADAPAAAVVVAAHDTAAGHDAVAVAVESPQPEQWHSDDEPPF